MLTGRLFVVLCVFFASGMTALMYQLFWMKQLALLFGNTTQATAMTLATFFSGLAVGSLALGRCVVRVRNSLRLYACLEVGVALGAVGYFALLPVYQWLYPLLLTGLGETHGGLVWVKCILVLLILFPAAFCMGGTLPVLSQFRVQQREQLGVHVSLLYWLNTSGAAVGAGLSGFYLPVRLGFHHSYWLTIGLSLVIAIVAWLLSRGTAVSEIETSSSETSLQSVQSPEQLSLPVLLRLAMLSGSLILALEVLWTRMFAQVLQNSVYTFAAILIVVLLALALGGVLANGLMRTRGSPGIILFGLLIASAFGVAITPFVFDVYTDGLRYIGTAVGWHTYMIEVFTAVAVVILPVLLLAGAVFPFLLRLAEPYARFPGQLVGQLTAMNTVGAIAGSLLAGFVLIEGLGLWASIRLCAMAYFLAAMCVLNRHDPDYPYWLAMPMIGVLLLVSVLDPGRLPRVRLEPQMDQESLLQLWEGSAATVAVIRRRNELKIKVNNYYTLGGTGSHELEALQGALPVLLHPKPDAVYVLGLGTGITAGGSLQPGVKQLVVSELLPEVIQASASYFADYTSGLFYDPRVRIVPEDGRTHLASTDARFDVIIADLFIPWKAGSGSLYTQEHYQAVRAHLRAGGTFMQWLPAYQLTWADFATIAQTLSSVFPQVTLWRGDFSTTRPVIGLLAQVERQPLSGKRDWVTLNKQTSGPPLLAHYAGNLSDDPGLSVFPLNRDDCPVIEYRSPLHQWSEKTDAVRWFTGEPLLTFLSNLQLGQTPERDDYLSHLETRWRHLPYAGLHLYRSQVMQQAGARSAARQAYQLYQNRLAEAEGRGPKADLPERLE